MTQPSTSRFATEAALAAYAAPLGGPFHGARYTAYGHSFGQVQSGPNVWAGSLYPARIRDLLHTDPALYNNRTVSGTRMYQILANVWATWTDGQGGLVTLLGNQNDLGAHTDPNAFKGFFRNLLTVLQGSTGKPPTVLVIKDVTSTAAGYALFATPPTDVDVAAYNGYLDSVVAEFPTGWIYVADPMADGWNPTTMTGPDGQHPNDRGMAHITASCIKALSGATFRPGLNPGITTPLIPVTTFAADTFTRPDSATTLGGTEVGGYAWTARSAGDTTGIAGISGSQAYAPGTNDTVMYIGDWVADGTVQATLATVGDAGLVFRAVTAADFYMLYAPPTGAYQLASRTTSYALTAANGASVTPASGDVLKAVMRNQTVKLYVNGVLVHTLTDTTRNTATRHGIRIGASASAVRFDNFSHTSALV